MEDQFLTATAPVNKRTDGRSSMGWIIRELRKENGITQEQLAARAHVSRTTIARLECGIFHTLSVVKLEAIAASIGVDMKTLLVKAEAVGESMSYRGHCNKIEFTLEYPAEGFRIHSLIPKRKEFFFGRIELDHQKTISSVKLPHPDQIYIHVLAGKILLLHSKKESLLRVGDCFVFSGRCDYEFYNPDQIKQSSAIFITYPSFIPV